MSAQLPRMTLLKAALKNKLAIPIRNGVHLIDVDNIIRIKASGSYTTIFLADAPPVLVSKSLKEIEADLYAYTFLRVHKSHLINLKYLTKYCSTKGGGVIEMADGSTVELARSHKPEFSEILKSIVL